MVSVLRSVARIPGVALSFILASALAGGVANADQMSVRVASPAEGELIAGMSSVSVEVTGNDGDVKVSFYMDGRLAFVDPTPPYKYDWNAGLSPRPWRIRVVASSSTGQTAETSLSTGGMESSEAVDVKIRQVSVTVLDKSGNFVKTLDESQFAVYEDGVKRQLTSFYKGDAALSLILLTDVSRSMLSGLRIQKSKLAAIEFVKSLRSQDYATVVAFNHGVYSSGGFTQDKQKLIGFIEPRVADGGTALYDTIIAGTRKLGERHGRKVIVLFSDGRDEHSAASLGEATDALLRSDTTLYAVGVGLTGDEQGQKTILEDWAKQTGGRAFFTNDVKDVAGFYSAIAEELRWQYSLGYPPPASRRTWHDIVVRIPGREDLKLRYRTGFLGE